VLDDTKEGLRLNGLAQYCHGTGFLGLMRNLGTPRNYHDRNVGKHRILGSLSEKTPAVEYRHHQVQ